MSIFRRSYYGFTGLIIVLLILEIGLTVFAPQMSFFAPSLSENGNYLWSNQTGPKPDRSEASSLRILQLGSSMTTFSDERLQKLLRVNRPEAEVIDCSVPGSTLQNNLYVYAEKCAKFEGVKVVVLQTSEVLESGSALLFFPEVPVQQRNTAYLLTNAGKSINTMKLKGRIYRDHFGLLNREMSPEEVRRVNELTAPPSFLYRYSQLYRYFSNRKYNQGQQSMRALDPKTENQRIDFPVKIVKLLKDEVEKHGAKLIVLNIPTHLTMIYKKKARGASVEDKSPGHFYRRDPEIEKRNFAVLDRSMKRFREMLEAEGITFIDSGDIFLNEADLDGLYNSDLYHLSDRGLDLAFGAVATRIAGDFTL